MAHPLPRQLRPPQYQPDHYTHLNFVIIFTIYLSIGMIIYLAEKTDHWAYPILSLPLIAALQNHLQILLHEGAHFHLHPNKKWNDLITETFCAVPFFGFLSHYRYFHFEHHKNLLDPKNDPEVEFYSEQRYHFQKQNSHSLAWMLFLDISGYHYFQFFFSFYRYLFQQMKLGAIPRISRGQSVCIALFYFPILAFTLLHGAYFQLFFYWLLPQFTFLFFFLKLQGYGEHGERLPPSSSVSSTTYTHHLGIIPRFFIYPLNSDLHLEHHLYPTQPWYRLRKIHHDLLKKDAFKKSTLTGYFKGSNSVLKTILWE